MSDDSVLDIVVTIAADVIGVDTSELTANTTPADVETWDSLAQLNLVMALEDEFAINFAASDLDDMTSIGAIAVLVAPRRRSTAR